MEPEVKELIDQIGRDYAELKTSLTQKAEQAAQGVVDPLIEAKLQKINESITEKEAARDKVLTELRSRVDIMATFGVGGEKADGGTPELRQYKQGLDSYLRRGNESGLRELERRALSVGSDPDGGYTVEADKSGRIVMRIYETSPVRQYASIQAISTDALEGLSDRDEVSASWVGETASRSETDTPTLGTWRIPVHEIYAKPKATQKLLDDSMVDIEGWLARKVADYFARTQNTAFVTGNGVNKPRGFASYSTAATADASRAWATFEHVATGGNGSFGSDPTGLQKLVTLVHKLNPAYVPNARWFMNRTTVAALRLLTDTSSQGKYVFIPDFSGTTAGSILGSPIVLLEDMATYTTTDALAVAFGDMRETYTIVDRIGIRTLRDPYSSKPYVEFYTTARVGGDVLNFDAMKFLKFGTT